MLLTPTSYICLLPMQPSVASALHVQYSVKVFLVGTAVDEGLIQSWSQGGFEVCPFFKHAQSSWMTMKLSVQKRLCK